MSIGLAAALGLAFLGGLVLNLMPCVLPVLAIKLVTLAELARRERGEVIAHTLAYTSGVLSTLLALGAVVAMLRAGGTAVGWGFQFQEPVFIAGIATVLVVFALNLFGVFEIQLGAGRLADLGSQATGARRSFFEGLLIVVLATPCSAPFLGTAVGFAFAGSAPVILAVFGAIGLGLAAPYVAIAFAPGWARWLPRSGGWMLHLRAGLGFVLLATAVWLLWIFGRNAGADGMAALLLFLVVVAAGVCGLVWLTPSDRPRVSRAARAALACSVLIGLAGFEAAFDDPVPSPSVGDSNWEPYDRELVARRVSGGKPAFVAFTADWCITCKLNEHSVLANDVVQEEFARHEVGRAPVACPIGYSLATKSASSRPIGRGETRTSRRNSPASVGRECRSILSIGRTHRTTPWSCRICCACVTWSPPFLDIRVTRR
ncbi:MAG: protein-disulfide reductase DsbD family protein [Myxococcota bacterium]